MVTLDIFVRDNPNIYLYLMLIIVNMMLALVIVGYPFALLVKTPYFFPLVTGFQPLVLIGVFVETLALRWSYGTAYWFVCTIRSAGHRIVFDWIVCWHQRTAPCSFIFARCSMQQHRPQNCLGRTRTNRKKRLHLPSFDDKRRGNPLLVWHIHEVIHPCSDVKDPKS